MAGDTSFAGNIICIGAGYVGAKMEYCCKVP